MKAFRNVKEAELTNIPKLGKCVLAAAFKCIKKAKVENASSLGELKELADLKPVTPVIPVVAARGAVVSSKQEWDGLNLAVEMITVSDGACNEDKFTALDLTKLASLKQFVVGNGCFKFVTEVKITGLSKLEAVTVGENSFTKHPNDCGNDPKRRFHLKDCPLVKSLTVGRYSFSDFTVCVIDSTPALETVEMGTLTYGEDCNAFWYASLELKSGRVDSE